MLSLKAPYTRIPKCSSSHVLYWAGDVMGTFSLCSPVVIVSESGDNVNRPVVVAMVQKAWVLKDEFGPF